MACLGVYMNGRCTLLKFAEESGSDLSFSFFDAELDIMPKLWSTKRLF